MNGGIDPRHQRLFVAGFYGEPLTLTSVFRFLKEPL